MTGHRRHTDAELAEIERWARIDLQGSIGQQANARRLLDLVAEIRRLRELLLLAYPYVPDKAEAYEAFVRIKAEIDGA